MQSLLSFYKQALGQKLCVKQSCEELCEFVYSNWLYKNWCCRIHVKGWVIGGYCSYLVISIQKHIFLWFLSYFHYPCLSLRIDSKCSLNVCLLDLIKCPIFRKYTLLTSFFLSLLPLLRLWFYKDDDTLRFLLFQNRNITGVQEELGVVEPSRGWSFI